VKFIIADALVYGFGDEKYDIILCNPPYIETDVIQKLDIQVKDFEPKMALDGGFDGLKFYKSLIPKLPDALRKDGVSLIEIGFNQGNSVVDICSQNNIKIKLVKDYGGNDRVLVYRHAELVS
jgi:release factor glutamine methyltransferase